jgi:hexokinase
MAQIERLEDLFIVDIPKLKEISDHFVNELKQGLTSKGGDIVSSASDHRCLSLTTQANGTNMVYGFSEWT